MSRTQFTRLVASLVTVVGFLAVLYAGVSKETETHYRTQFENKAMFLKLPVSGGTQILYVRGSGTVAGASGPEMQVIFKVAEQVRVTQVDFKDASVEFALASLDGAQTAKLVFQFASALNYSFSERPAFDSALQATFTEGLTYQEIDRAKKEYIQGQTGRLVRKFASTTNTSPDFVRTAMLSSDPSFKKSVDQAAAIERRVKELEQALAEETAKLRRAENDLGSSKADLLDVNRSATEMRKERDDLAQKYDALTKEVSGLKSANREAQAQLDSVAGKLDLQTGSNAELGKQLEALSKEIDTLKTDRNRLSVRVKELGEELAGVTRERDKLSGDLKSTERRATRLQSNLNCLTSNRNSLEANFLKTKEQKENLELARELEQSINLRQSHGSENGETVQLTEVYLLSQKIGEIEVQLPVDPEETCRIAYRADSPDLVQFSEDERRLYEAFGAEVQVENEWRTGLNGVEAVLQEGEPVQSIPHREQGHWVWGFQGGERVLVASQDFEFASNGVLAGFAGSFSVFSLLVGLCLGAGGYKLVTVLWGRKSSNGRPADRQARYAAQKQL
jgi:predicted  nucleic acid-binding Zn-ribbon protein